MRDRLSRLRVPAGDDGRTVLEAVVALSIIAATASAWVQMTTVAARTEVAGDRHEDAAALAASEVEVLRVTPDIERGTDGAGGATQFDGLAILTSGTGPDHRETVAVDGHDFVVERYVLDTGSTTWRRLAVVVTWTDDGVDRDLRVDTAIPVLPDPVTVGVGNLLVNGSFEMASGGPSSWGRFVVDGWSSSTGVIEVWASGFNGVPASEGDYLAEVNGDGPETIFQTVSVSPGTTYRWSIDHRGRDDVDTMEVLIDGAVVATVSSPVGTWITYTGLHTAAASTLELGFRGVDSGGSANLIDNAQLVAVS